MTMAAAESVSARCRKFAIKDDVVSHNCVSRTTIVEFNRTCVAGSADVRMIHAVMAKRENV